MFRWYIRKKIYKDLKKPGKGFLGYFNVISTTLWPNGNPKLSFRPQIDYFTVFTPLRNGCSLQPHGMLKLQFTTV